MVAKDTTQEPLKQGDKVARDVGSKAFFKGAICPV